ncbi:biotin carboxylase, partial [Streptomyces sp. SID8455]|nr:biotin carboxylase [Streptomyces sp. SID8455]
MGKYRVAVIGGRPAPVAGAKELGIDVVLVHEEGAYDVAVAQHCERIIHGPLDDGPAILELLKPLHAERPFDRVLTTTEPAAESTGFVVDALGLPGV